MIFLFDHFVPLCEAIELRTVHGKPTTPFVRLPKERPFSDVLGHQSAVFGESVRMSSVIDAKRARSVPEGSRLH
jgi:hypothetical protein